MGWGTRLFFLLTVFMGGVVVGMSVLMLDVARMATQGDLAAIKRGAAIGLGGAIVVFALLLCSALAQGEGPDWPGQEPRL
jgi:hypothetical protein